MKDGHYCYSGSILCSKNFPEGILYLVEKELLSARFVMHKGANLSLVQEHDGCHTYSYYRKRVCFRVSSLHEKVQIKISSITSGRKIGGFLTSLTSLLKCQQVFEVFGRSDHRTDQWPPSRTCYCSITKKRQNEDLFPTQQFAKRRKLKWQSEKSIGSRI